MSVITISDVTKVYGKTTVLKGFSGTFGDGEFVTLLGSSGCGKTTLLRMIAGFEKVSSGSIAIDGEVVSSQEVFVAPEKRGIGMVFQSYAVWPHMNVFDNVAYPLKLARMKKDEIHARVQKALEAVHLESYAKRMPSELSGGQQQRVALARALVSEPKVLLLDEPLSNLDAKLREDMRFEIKFLQRQYGITVVYVTHDQSEAFTMSDRIFVIHEGEIRQIGTPVEIYTHPADASVSELLGQVNVFEGVAEDGHIRLTGETPQLLYDGALSGKVSVGIRTGDFQVFAAG